MYTYIVNSAEEDTCTVTGVEPGTPLTAITIPETIDGRQVTRIGPMAFRRRELSGPIVIPDTVTEIGYAAFEMSSGATALILGQNLTKIDTCAFSECKFDGNLILTKSVKIVGWMAFAAAGSLDGRLIFDEPSSLRRIDCYAFSGSPLCQGRLLVPSSVKFIDDYAFVGHHYDSWELPWSAAIGEAVMSRHAVGIPHLAGHKRLPEMSDNEIREANKLYSGRNKIPYWC